MIIRRTLTILCIVALGLLGAATAAIGSDPATSSVSKSKPTDKWGGTVAPSGCILTMDTCMPFIESCSPPTCDSHDMTLDTGGAAIVDSEISFTMSCPSCATGSEDADIYVFGPGMKLLGNSTGSTVNEKVIVADPEPGKYTIRVGGSVGQVKYEVNVLFTFPAGSPSPSPGPSTTTTTSTNPPSPAPSGPRTTPLQINFNRVGGSFKPYNTSKKIVVKARSSEPIKNLRATLKAKSGKGKLVGKGALANLSGKGQLTLKLTAKLAKGKYLMTVTGVDAQGRTGKVTAILNFR